MIRPALARLTGRHPALKMRIICSRFPDWPEINVEKIAWSSATEAESLAAAHIGVMPLTDDEWSRGKCAFKLLQYMAAALPCVASPIGANTEAVIDGVNGFHARSDEEWVTNYRDFLLVVRDDNGTTKAHVESRYSMSVYRTRYLDLLAELAAEARPD